MEKMLVMKNNEIYGEEEIIDFMLEQDIDTLSDFLNFDLVLNPRTIDDDDIRDRLNEMSFDEKTSLFTEMSKDKKLEEEIKEIIINKSLDLDTEQYSYRTVDGLSKEVKTHVKNTSDYHNGFYTKEDIIASMEKILLEN